MWRGKDEESPTWMQVGKTTKSTTYCASLVSLEFANMHICIIIIIIIPHKTWDHLVAYHLNCL